MVTEYRKKEGGGGEEKQFVCSGEGVRTTRGRYN